MRSDTAFFSAADISRRFLAGLASDLSAVAAAFVGEEERRDVERAFGADAPRICSTSVKALISAWRRSISLWRSAIACAISLMPVESSGPAMGMSNTNAGFLSPGRGHVGGSAGSRRGSERGRGHERRPSRHGSDRGRSQKVGDRAGAAATTWAAAHEPYLSLIAPSLVAGVPPDGEVADATRRCCCSPDVGYPGCAPRAVAATAGPRQRRARDLRRGGGALPRHRGLEEVGARGWGFEIEGLAMRGEVRSFARRVPVETRRQLAYQLRKAKLSRRSHEQSGPDATCTWPMPGIVRAVEGLEAGPMTAASWGCCAARRRPGELLTRGDVCHVHADRGEAERCGVLLGGAPELLRLDEVRPAVYRVAWSLSSAASGRLRRRSPGLGNYDSRRPSVARLGQ